MTASTLAVGPPVFTFDCPDCIAAHTADAAVFRCERCRTVEGLLPGYLKSRGGRLSAGAMLAHAEIVAGCQMGFCSAPAGYPYTPQKDRE